MILEEVKKYLFTERQFPRVSWLYESFNKVIQLIGSESIETIYYKNFIDEDKEPILYFFTDNMIYIAEFNAQMKGVKLDIHKLQSIKKMTFKIAMNYQTELIIELMDSEPIVLNSKDGNPYWIETYSGDILKIGQMIAKHIK